MTAWVITFCLLVLWVGKVRQHPMLVSSARIAIALVVLLLTPPVMARLMALAESLVPASMECGRSPPDAIVVFMGGVYPDFMGTASWSSLMPASLARLEHGLAVHRETENVPLYIAASNEERVAVEAILNPLQLSERSSIEFLTDISNTFDSVAAVSRLQAKTQPTRYGIVTSAFHMARTAQTLRRFGIEFCTYPAHFLSDTRIPPPWIIPTRSTVAHMDLLLHELVGSIWYRVRR